MGIDNFLNIIENEGPMVKKLSIFITLSLLIGLIFVPSVLASNSATVAATVSAQNISLTVSTGTVSYGTLTLGGSVGTNPASTQTITNNGNVAEDFVISGANTADWALGATAGSETYVHKFCITTCGTPPTNYTALTTGNQSLASNIAANGTQNFDLYITVPTVTTHYTQETANVTITASAH